MASLQLLLLRCTCEDYWTLVQAELRTNWFAIDWLSYQSGEKHNRGQKRTRKIDGRVHRQHHAFPGSRQGTASKNASCARGGTPLAERLAMA